MKSDSKLQQDVMAELQWEPAVNATQMGVQVNDGVVTLTGHVYSYAQKWHAEKAVERVSGVKALVVDIEVILPSTDRRDDNDIARSVSNVLKWFMFPKDAIKVRVEKGWVTLSGTLEWQYQRHIAADTVRYLMGVTGVSNQIGIQHKPLPSSVKADIESALERGAKAEANNIQVAIDGSEVTLTGTVHSWPERELARHAAWATPGVRNVVDKIKIA